MSSTYVPSDDYCIVVNYNSAPVVTSTAVERAAAHAFNSQSTVLNPTIPADSIKQCGWLKTDELGHAKVTKPMRNPELAIKVLTEVHKPQVSNRLTKNALQKRNFNYDLTGKPIMRDNHPLVDVKPISSASKQWLKRQKRRVGKPVVVPLVTGTTPKPEMPVRRRLVDEMKRVPWSMYKKICNDFPTPQQDAPRRVWAEMTQMRIEAIDDWVKANPKWKPKLIVKVAKVKRTQPLNDWNHYPFLETTSRWNKMWEGEPVGWHVNNGVEYECYSPIKYVPSFEWALAENSPYKGRISVVSQKTYLKQKKAAAEADKAEAKQSESKRSPSPKRKRRSNKKEATPEEWAEATKDAKLEPPMSVEECSIPEVVELDVQKQGRFDDPTPDIVEYPFGQDMTVTVSEEPSDEFPPPPNADEMPSFFDDMSLDISDAEFLDGVPSFYESFEVTFGNFAAGEVDDITAFGRYKKRVMLLKQAIRAIGIPQSQWLHDLTADGDVEANPGPVQDFRLLSQ
jgi:hypothetical protein